MTVRSSTPTVNPPGQLAAYTDPKNPPIAVNAAASASLTRIRVRIRTPAAGAATTGSATRRNRAPTPRC